MVERLRISVVIPAYNAGRTLTTCLQALNSQTCPPDEVILVNDGSTDDTAAIAEQQGVIVLAQQQQGPAAARNAGVKQATGDLILFSDADCAPVPEWIERLSVPFADTGISGAKGSYRTRQRSLVARFVQQEYEGKYERLKQQPTIDFIDTYSAAYRRAVFIANGGFDESFRRPSVEDQEFSFRLARKGHRMVFVPDATVYHVHDEDLLEYARRKYGIGYWKAYMLRWLPEKSLSDSHTPPSLRIQILLLAAGLVCLALGFVWLPLVYVGLACIVALLVSAGTLFNQIIQRDPAVLVVAPLLVLLRALALGTGLLMGMLFAPRLKERREGLSFWTRPAKRLIDVLSGLVGSVLPLPIIIIAAFLIRLESPGSPLFVQVRAGENGKPFRMYKLRTMFDGSEEQLHDVLQANPLQGPVFKLPNDPRITRVGRFLRRWSIDELPQFWNVLAGDMSLVGPRPEEMSFVQKYNETQRLRLIVKPGLTGPAQIAGRGELNFEQRLSLELDYIRNYSPMKDIRIVWRTLGAVIGGRGAF